MAVLVFFGQKFSCARSRQAEKLLILKSIWEAEEHFIPRFKTRAYLTFRK